MPLKLFGPLQFVHKTSSNKIKIVVRVFLGVTPLESNTM